MADTVNAMFQEMVSLYQEGAYPEAEAIGKTILLKFPNHANTNHLLGLIAGRHGDYDLATRLIADAISNAPGNPLSHYHLGVALQKMGRFDEALNSYEEALRIKPDYAEAYIGLGNVCSEQGKYEDSLVYYKNASSLMPESAELEYNIGLAYKEQSQYDQALVYYQKALLLRPDMAEAHNSIGNIYKEQESYKQALACYKKALSVSPDYAEAHFNLGNVYKELENNEQALNSYRSALAIRPTIAEAHINIGDILQREGRTAEAIASYRSALEIQPSSVSARWGELLALPVLYDSAGQVKYSRDRWIKGVNELLKTIDLKTEKGIREAKLAACRNTNFYLNYQGCNDIDQQVIYGKLIGMIANAAYPDHKDAGCSSIQLSGNKIKVGFVSSFFFHHSIFKTHGRWITELDRREFDVSVFYSGYIKDAATEEIINRADHFFMSRDVDDLIRAISEQKLDILIYTDLGMEPRLQLISALRLCPVQCNGGGHPVTSGLPTIDYFFGSSLMEPENGDDHYSEKLVRLPNLAFSYPRPKIGKAMPPPGSEHDLSKVIFLNMQSLFKLLPQHDDLYPRIALKVPECQFRFIGGLSRKTNDQFAARLRQAFMKHGLEANDYCVIYPRLSQDDFYGLVRSSDLILDGITWSGNNSSMEALFFDKPVVTLPGKMFRSRHTYGILRYLGVTTTIAHDIEDYIAIAARLGQDPEYRNFVSVNISRRKAKIYDDNEVIRGLENTLRSIVCRKA